MIGNPTCKYCYIEAMRVANAEHRMAELEQQLVVSQAALRASTDLMRALNREYLDGGRKPYWKRVAARIAKNEAAMGGGK